MSEQPVPATKPDDQLIDAGEVGELKDLPFHEAQHQAETARSLAKWLVVLLPAGLVVHYLLVCILAFAGKEEAVKNLSAIFNAWAISPEYDAIPTIRQIMLAIEPTDNRTWIGFDLSDRPPQQGFFVDKVFEVSEAQES